VLPTIDAAEEAAILAAVGAAPLQLPGFNDGILRPLAAFIPDVTRSNVLPGDDYIYDSDGSDVFVGDMVTGSASLLINSVYNIPEIIFLPLDLRSFVSLTFFSQPINQFGGNCNCIIQTTRVSSQR
jgi:hypothetical protein